jgi:hypothetical protein
LLGLPLFALVLHQAERHPRPNAARAAMGSPCVDRRDSLLPYSTHDCTGPRLPPATARSVVSTSSATRGGIRRSILTGFVTTQTPFMLLGIFAINVAGARRGAWNRWLTRLVLCVRGLCCRVLSLVSPF